MRKSSSRNQRSRGIKAKHILQICVLLGVCVWLIYQLKYSHEKKKEFYEKDTKSSAIFLGEDKILRFGRKDLPRVQEVSENEKHYQEEISGEASENHDEDGVVRNHVEEEQEDDDENKKGEEDEPNEEESKNGEEHEILDDDVDERDQYKTGETDREDEFLEEEKKREGDDDGGDDDDEKERESDKKENEEENSQGGVDRNTHEAREEQYKADDASSAVFHETHVKNETLKGNLEISDGKAEEIALEQENKSNTTEEMGREQNRPVLSLGEVEGGDSLNTTNAEGKDNESESSDLDLKRVAESGGGFDAGNSTNEVRAETESNSTVISLESSKSLENRTESATESSTARGEASNLQTIKLEQLQKSDSDLSIPANTENSNLTVGQFSNLTSESGLPGKITNSNSRSDWNENSESYSAENLESLALKKDESDRTEGSSDSLSKNHSLDELENDPVDVSDPMTPHEEKKALTGLATLPDVRTEGVDGEETGAE